MACAGFKFDNFEFVKWLSSPERGAAQCQFGKGFDDYFLEKPRFIHLLPPESVQRKTLLIRRKFFYFASTGQWESLHALLLSNCAYSIDDSMYYQGAKEALFNRQYEVVSGMLDAVVVNGLLAATKYENLGKCPRRMFHADTSALLNDALKAGEIDAAIWLYTHYPDLLRRRIYAGAGTYDSFTPCSLAFLFGLHEKSLNNFRLNMDLNIFIELLHSRENEAVVEKILANAALVQEIQESAQQLADHPQVTYEAYLDIIISRYCFNKVAIFLKIIELTCFKLDADMFRRIMAKENIYLLNLVLQSPASYPILMIPATRAEIDRYWDHFIFSRLGSVMDFLHRVDNTPADYGMRNLNQAFRALAIFSEGGDLLSYFKLMINRCIDMSLAEFEQKQAQAKGAEADADFHAKRAKLV